MQPTPVNCKVSGMTKVNICCVDGATKQNQKLLSVQRTKPVGDEVFVKCTPESNTRWCKRCEDDEGTEEL